MPENVAAVFQIDELNGGVPRLLAVAPAIDGLLTGRMSVPCDGNVITVLSIQQEDPAAVRSGTRHPWGRGFGPAAMGSVDGAAHGEPRA